MTVYLFAGFKLDTTKSELSHDDVEIKVEPQTIAILECLVENAGQLVTKDTLIERIWDGRIISRAVLDNRIRSVRQAIGDTGKDQSFIKTYPNRGYKFVANVERISPSEKLEPTTRLQASLENNSVANNAEAYRSKLNPKLMATAVAAFAAISALGFFFWPGGLSDPNQTESAAKSIELATSNDQSQSISNRPFIRVLPTEFASDYAPQDEAAARNFSLRAMTLFGAIPGFQVANATGETVDDLENSYSLRISWSSDAPETILTASLENQNNGAVAWSKHYRLDEERIASAGWEDTVARNIVLSSANALGVSTSLINDQSTAFEIAENYREAVVLMRRLDPESIERSRELLNQIISTEPDYLPAYAGLYDLTHIELNHTDSDLNEMFLRMDETAAQMYALAPSAPETLTVRALQSGFDLSELTQAAQTPMDLFLAAIAGAPHYFRAHEELAKLYEDIGETDLAMTYYNSALQHHSNCPIILANKSSAQMCSGDELQALGTANLNFRRNPDHRMARIRLLDFAIKTGDYEHVKTHLADLATHQNAGYHEKILGMRWLLMIGDYRSALRYTVDPHEAAYVHALLGEREKALSAAAEMPGYSYTARALHLLGDDSIMLAMLETEFEQSVGIHIPGHGLSACHVYNAVYFADVVKSSNPETSEALRRNLQNYFDANPIETFRHLDEYTALAGLYALNGDLQGAIQTISKANEEGLVFLYRLEDPVFSAIRQNPEFEREVEKMRAHASSLMASIAL